MTGPSDAVFVINLSGSLTLDGSGGIIASGGVLSSHVLVNMTGTGSNLISTHVDNIINAVVLGPNAGGTIHSANGSFLLGRDFTLMSGAHVNFGVAPRRMRIAQSTETCVLVTDRRFGQCQRG